MPQAWPGLAPSADDLRSTEDLKSPLAHLDVRVMDDLLVGGNGARCSHILLSARGYHPHVMNASPPSGLRKRNVFGVPLGIATLSDLPPVSLSLAGLSFFGAL